MSSGWFRALEALVRHVEQPGAGGRSPSDLPLVALSQGEIERLERQYPQIEDVLPLSPLQEGLLFHALYDAQAPDLYTVQMVLALEGVLDSATLQAAAQALLARHASLRAAFRHEHLNRPAQIIVPRAQLPWRQLDLSSLDEASRTARLAAFLAEDRSQRFDLGAPPLLRFALVRLAADEHRLVLTHHHILMDGWSTPVLVQELLTLYAHQGDAAVLPRVTPYRDYHTWIAGQDRAAAVSAWREALAGVEEATRIAPFDPERIAVAPEQIALSLSEPLTAALTRQARSLGLTLNTFIQATWAILLGRLTGRDDVVFGVTVACRPPEIAGIERMVGLFINTLPLRVGLPATKPLRELLEEVQERQSVLMAHQHLGLAEVQALAGLGELFDTLTVFENYPLDRESLAASVGGLRLTDVAGLDVTHYPLGLAALPGERLQLRLHYRPDLFDQASAEAMMGRLVRLFEAAAADPDQAIGRIDLLAAEERRTILRGWNDTARTLPPATFPELFATQAARSPDAVAVVCEDRTLAYGELDARANQLAHYLRTLGVGPETVVALCAGRSPEMLIGLLGILKAGGAYLPLDPRYPSERLAYMLEDAGAPVIVTQSALCDRLPAGDARIVRLDADWPAIATRPSTAPLVALDPRNAAYVIYTSGSTGIPKAVTVDHAAFANKLLTLGQDFKVAPGFRSALLISSAFDAAIEQTMLPFVGGGAAVVISDAVRDSPAQFWRQVIRDGVTFISCVPSYLDSVIRHAPPVLALDQLALGGEAFTAEFQQEIARHLKVARITNLYGPTEATIDAIALRWRANNPRRRSRSAGRCPTTGLMCWTQACSRFLPASRASSTLRVRGWRAAIWVAPG